jgi:uncharacterized protein
MTGFFSLLAPVVPLVRLVAALLATAVVWAAPAVAQPEGARRSVSIATASQTGNYFVTGSAICRMLQRQGLYLASGDLTLVDCATTPTSGSVQNVDLIRGRTVDVALVQSDWQLHAANGTSRFAGRKVENLRALLSLNPEAFQVLAGRGTGIEAWPDLKAKKVNLGPLGSTGQSMFQDLLELHKVDSKWLTQGLGLPITAHVQELCEGNIEALGQTSGIPNTGLADAARRCGATLVRLDTPEIKGLLKARSDLTSILVPANTYVGQTADVPTFGVLATLVATTDLPDTVAYSIVRAVMDNLDELGAMVPVLKGLDPKRMIQAGLSVPLHPGAERYYRERGWLSSAARAPAKADVSANDVPVVVAPAPAPAVGKAVKPKAKLTP